jgi:ribosomal protein L33
MAKKKGNRQFVLMTSKEDKRMRYTTKVNTMNMQTKKGQAFKLKLKKYSPTLRKHVEFVQTKIK